MTMAADDGKWESLGGYHPYFVVSYARSPMIFEDPDVDQWVSTFFRDLESMVSQYASRRSGPIHGFFDQRTLPGLGWKESLSQALSAAQVFVPLYSDGYFTKSLPGREWACFRQRTVLAGVTDPESRFMPVLWTPLFGTQDPPGLTKALALGRDAPGYVKNGLWPMLKIKSYHDSYRTVVNLLAKGIVVLAEESPIRPSEVPDIDEMKSAFPPTSPLAIFAVETATPAARESGTGYDSLDPGESDDEWRPFPQQELPLTQYASHVIERFDFQVEVSRIKKVSDPRTRRPGIILIDPWFIADDNGQSELQSALRQLPRWVLPLLILSKPGDRRTRDLADRVREILVAARALHTDLSRQAAQGVGSLDDFLSIVPSLVMESERQYLRYRSGRVRSQPSARRPSLRRPGPDQPALTPEKPTTRGSLGETPDA